MSEKRRDTCYNCNFVTSNGVCKKKIVHNLIIFILLIQHAKASHKNVSSILFLMHYP